MEGRRKSGEGRPSPHRSEPILDRVLEQREELGELGGPDAADAPAEAGESDEPPSDPAERDKTRRRRPSPKRLAEARDLLDGIRRTGTERFKRKR